MLTFNLKQPEYFKEMLSVSSRNSLKAILVVFSKQPSTNDWELVPHRINMGLLVALALITI